MAGAALRRCFQATLRDGTRVSLRCVEPADKQRLRDGIRLFTPETLYRRFFAPISELSDQQLRFLTEVDQVDHVAWGAIDDDHPEIPGLGVGRWVRIPDEPTVAETALIVLDAYQGRGLGTLLLAVLDATAAAQRVTTLRALVLAENDRFIRTLVGYGGCASHEHDGMMRVELPVYGDAASVPSGPRSVAYARAIAQVQQTIA
jgi:GNAT superfamily N-acetyltransferase